MHPVEFPGSREIKKPNNMTDEECFSIWAMMVDVPRGKSPEGEDVFSTMWVEAWKPSREDIQAINRGEPVWIQIHSRGLPPVAVFTVDENGNSNDAG